MSETRPCPWCGVYAGRSVHGCTIAPTLTMHPSEPKVPSWQEMAQAIVAWSRHPDHGLIALRHETDFDLWGLASRLGAWPLPDAHSDARSVDSEPATLEVAPIATSSDQGPLACGAPLDRLGEALAAMTASRDEIRQHYDEIRQHYDEVRDQLIRVSARSCGAIDGLEGPLACDAPLDQPMPRQNGGEPVLPAARAEFLRVSEQQGLKGIARYGVALRTQNGRNPIADAKQESADLWHYLQQADMERAELHAALRRWVVARDAWAKDDQQIAAVNEVLDSSAALHVLARSVLGVGEGE